MNSAFSTQSGQASMLPVYATSGRRTLLQRKCACGGTPGPSGECAACRAKRLGVQRAVTPTTVAAVESQAVPSLVHDTLRTPGQPLDTTTRGLMESRFGHNFSQVRIHTNAQATESAAAVNAAAYTVGRHVVFGAGQYQPQSPSGKWLIAHELAHVVQQKQSSGNESPLALGQHNSAHEREADAAAQRVGDSAGPTARLTSTQSGLLQRVGPAGAAAGGAAAGLVIGYVTFEAALAYAQSLATRYPGWLSTLPACPCRQADVVADPATWAADANPALSWFHPGAAASFRSVASFSSVAGSSHGQQCTYDSAGNLITAGPGAGTPDVWSPNTNTANHLLYDAATWQVLGWRIYNRYWTPNNGNNCASNQGDNTFMRRFAEFIP